jgi:hypothetical protein
MPADRRASFPGAEITPGANDASPVREVVPVALTEDARVIEASMARVRRSELGDPTTALRSP